MAKHGKSARKSFTSKGWTAKANPDRAQEQVRENSRLTDRIAQKRKRMGFDVDSNVYVPLDENK